MTLLVTQVMTGMAQRNVGELGAAARTDLYLRALREVPPWAVDAAIDGWVNAAYGDKYDYHWAPEPVDLGKLARLEVAKVKGRALDLERLASAVELVEYSDEHRGQMLKKFGGLMTELGFSSSAEEPVAPATTPQR